MTLLVPQITPSQFLVTSKFTSTAVACRTALPTTNRRVRFRESALYPITPRPSTSLHKTYAEASTINTDRSNYTCCPWYPPSMSVPFENPQRAGVPLGTGTAVPENLVFANFFSFLALTAVRGTAGWDPSGQQIASHLGVREI